MPERPPEFVSIEFGMITAWEKNPRQILPDKLRLLAKSMEKWGQFQTLTCWKEGEPLRYVTGGGNMRWRAMKEILKFPASKLVQVSVNYLSSEAEKIELSFLDNQHFGFYNELDTASLIKPFENELTLSELEVYTGKSVDLQTLLKDMTPDESTLPILDIWDEDNVEGIKNRMPIFGEWTVVGVGNYSGMVKRTVVEPVVSLLTRKYGLTREGRRRACEWIIEKTLGELERELGAAPPPGKIEDIHDTRMAQREARKAAEREEYEELKKKKAVKKQDA